MNGYKLISIAFALSSGMFAVCMEVAFFEFFVILVLSSLSTSFWINTKEAG